jgi:hypothetical protein
LFFSQYLGAAVFGFTFTHRWDHRQLEQILRILRDEQKPHRDRLVLVRVVDKATGFEFTGRIDTMKMSDSQVCTIEWGAPITAKGKPAKVEQGSVKITCSDDSVTIEVDPANPFKATLTAVHENEDTGAVLTITADADLGEGVVEISGSEPLVITSGPAVGFGPASIGTPTEQP